MKKKNTTQDERKKEKKVKCRFKNHLCNEAHQIISVEKKFFFPKL